MTLRGNQTLNSPDGVPERPDALLDLDEPSRLQRPQRVSYDRPADAELFAKFIVWREQVSGRELALEDAVLEQPGYLFGEGCAADPRQDFRHVTAYISCKCNKVESTWIATGFRRRALMRRPVH